MKGKVIMKMSRVERCDITDCAYNMDNTCHTIAITIGDTAHPRCDTFCQSTMKGGDMSCFANVGACKVSACSFNSGLECQASEISVGYKEQEPDCLTFQQK